MNKKSEKKNWLQKMLFIMCLFITFGSLSAGMTGRVCHAETADNAGATAVAELGADSKAGRMADDTHNEDSFLPVFFVVLIILVVVIAAVTAVVSTISFASAAIVEEEDEE